MRYAWGPENRGVEVLINPERLPEILPSDVVSFDFETDESDAKIPCGLGAYIPRLKLGVYVTDWTKRYIGSLLQVPMLRGHNVKFDLHKAREIGFEAPLGHVIADTKLMAYVADTNSSAMNLKEMAQKLLGHKRPHYLDLTRYKLGKATRKREVSELDIELQAAYCISDCLDTHLLAERDMKVRPDYVKRFYDNIEFPFMKLLYEIEKQGVMVDADYLESLNGYFEETLDDKQQTIWNLAGKEFKLSSNPQKLEVLQALGFRVEAVNKKALSEYIDKPLIQGLLEWNSMNTLKNSFSKKLPIMARASRDGRIHTNYGQNTFTGRLTSSKPNIQNIPRRGVEGKKVRKGFIPKEGYRYLASDLSQIEMRVVAHLSKEPVWTEGFMKGQDVHDTTAEAANCTRDEAKTINYAILFGAGTKTIAYGAKCSVARAEEFMDTLKNRATTFLDWKEKQEKHAYEKGFITTLYGRNIYVPEIRSRDNEAAAHGKRQVLSGLVQGSAADMLKVAMLRLRKHGIIPVTTTHDEIGVEVRENEAEDVADIVKYEMENSTVLDVPVLTEVAVGDNWGVK